jgi:tetratricopeptide (TPR) repeat protein
MAAPSPTPIPFVDPPVVQAVGDLRAYLKDHPEARTTRLALDSIVEHLIGDIIASGKPGSGDPNLTIPRLEEVAALFPDNPIPLLHLSKVCIDRGEHQAALRYTDAGLALDPEWADLLMNQGLCLLETGQQDAAIDAFKHYLELDPDNPWAYNNLGDAYRTIGLYDQAENYLKLAIQKDHRFGPAYFNLTMLYMDQHDWPRCLHFARIAARHDPFNKDVHLALADAYMELDEPESAVQHAVIATLVDRGYVEAYETLASAYLALGTHELSLAAAREALKLNPDSWQAHSYIGQVRAKQGDYADAIHFLLEALQRNPDEDGQYSLCWELGWTYFQTGEYAPALEYTDRAIQMKEFPDLALLFNKGLILLAQGKVQEAEAVYDRTLTRARALDNFGAIRDAAREASELVSEKGLRLDNGSPILKLLGGRRDHTA